MIVSVATMKKCEEQSTLSNLEIMEEVAFKIAVEIKKRKDSSQRICIVCGTGNNGGDGFALAKILHQEGYEVTVLASSTKQITNESKIMREALPRSLFLTLEQACDASFDLIVDGLYGCGFHDQLNSEDKRITTWMNAQMCQVYSIDINSGAMADTGYVDEDAVSSTITFALGFHKLFHCLRKDHNLFKEVVCIPLSIPTPKQTDIHEMNEAKFVEQLWPIQENSYKGQTGKALIIGGCMGMAGAVAHNILGAKASGCTYNHVAVDEAIYPILASREITPVFHPFTKDTMHAVIEPLLKEVDVVGYGSGVTNLFEKRRILEHLLQQRKIPVILDAEAIRLLVDHLYILNLVQTTVILTPHIKEFADLLNVTVEELNKDKINMAKQFVKEYKVYLVLKGPCTLVITPDEEIYINQTGNAALARAGSGDFLVGLLTGILAQKKNIFMSLMMGVWLHGHAADRAVLKHPLATMQPEFILEAIDEFYLNHKR